MIKLFFIAMFLAGCGNTIPSELTVTTPTPTPAVGDPEATATTPTDATGSTTASGEGLSPTEGTKSTPSVASPQIKYIVQLIIPGVQNIYSAAKIADTFYFTGLNDKGFKIFGIFHENKSLVRLKAFSDIEGMGFTLPNKELTLTYSSADIELNDAETQMIYVIDATTYAISRAFQTECASQINQKSVFVHAQIRMRVYIDKLLGCGMAGGDIVFTQDIEDSVTNDKPSWLTPEHAPQYGFDGKEFFQYDAQAKSIVQFDKNFNKTAQYSTAGYAENNRASVVLDNDGSLWFFGCVRGTCSVTTAKVDK